MSSSPLSWQAASLCGPEQTCRAGHRQPGGRAVKAASGQLPVEDRAILTLLLTAEEPLSCQSIVQSVGWKVGPVLCRLERGGMIVWVDGGYRIAGEGGERA